MVIHPAEETTCIQTRRVRFHTLNMLSAGATGLHPRNPR
jgi:hypothetical protein